MDVHKFKDLNLFSFSYCVFEYIFSSLLPSKVHILHLSRECLSLNVNSKGAIQESRHPSSKSGIWVHVCAETRSYMFLAIFIFLCRMQIFGLGMDHQRSFKSLRNHSHRIRHHRKHNPTCLTQSSTPKRAHNRLKIMRPKKLHPQTTLNSARYKYASMNWKQEQANASKNSQKISSSPPQSRYQTTGWPTGHSARAEKLCINYAILVTGQPEAPVWQRRVAITQSVALTPT